MKRAFVIYPSSEILCTTPHSFGRAICETTSNLGYETYSVSCESIGVIDPNGDLDILIGHPWSVDGTIFRESMTHNKWKRVISVFPFHCMAHTNYPCGVLDSVMDRSDHIFYISGPVWQDYFPMKYKHKATRLDVCIDQSFYPQVKFCFNPKGERRFLYIGSGMKEKGANMVELMACSKELFGMIGHIGKDTLHGVIHHGFLDLTSLSARNLIKNYDFLIAPAINDANPTSVLEAASLGLIPITTHDAGWGGDINRFFYSDYLKNMIDCLLDWNEKEEDFLLNEQKSIMFESKRYPMDRFIDPIKNYILDIEGET